MAKWVQSKAKNIFYILTTKDFKKRLQIFQIAEAKKWRSQSNEFVFKNPLCSKSEHYINPEMYYHFQRVVQYVMLIKCIVSALEAQ